MKIWKIWALASCCGCMIFILGPVILIVAFEYTKYYFVAVDFVPTVCLIQDSIPGTKLISDGNPRIPTYKQVACTFYTVLFDELGVTYNISNSFNISRNIRSLNQDERSIETSGWVSSSMTP